MISGVILVLFGEALVLLSRPHGIWAVSFMVLNLIYLPLVEEPGLERRFGDSYLVSGILPAYPAIHPASGAEAVPALTPFLTSRSSAIGFLISRQKLKDGMGGFNLLPRFKPFPKPGIL